ncbi:MAG: lysine N(6)-hydroxylase/L-ornithine N(5)-oxygenase family protein [Synechococcus sp. SB0666_bin_14]|nr:lysine N(6)-hydroxylase/L-ornithine N(5)-oxygenase family protein [Synechococcus sp. SB0666_bin_14]MYG47307.1 lysine N(6)-hydroxylase/L-ornithine N(5)-oxygenase family protein [Synechococcus sp. SB0675_bin_6]MYJ60525.1 lysine N(6)-hydroxylase/L-ornithine N(5)-oxygenase family protein [Synechococcus sp. SB0672_bin_6]MYK91373.1 lysine N(6)-hydroxylase/L-ornithine N(5)-oxygenase family protein [Synechococcus sp. SB0669_bin_8]
MADLVIVGAGPQALSLCCLLLQKRPRWRGRLRIIDPSGRWLSRWQRQMERFEIPCLRSPAPHHPHPNPNALRSYAQERRRSRELEGPYGLPRTGLFSEFCQSVMEDFQVADQVQAVSLEEIHLEAGRPGPLQLAMSDGSLIQARRLVIATGAGEPVLPNWVQRIPRPYPKEALQHSRMIDLAACRELQGQHVLIVGGGLTSAHLALGAIKQGARVSLLCRRKLRSKLFDSDPGWLGPKYLKAFQSETCWRQRRRQVLAARDGGSITPRLAVALQQECRQGSLQTYENCQIRQALWSTGQWRILCDEGTQLLADRIWLATGHNLGVSRQPLLRQLHKQQQIQLVDDWPVLSHDLRWPGTNVHLMGGLAALRLGPAARNLFGGREAARLISRAAIKA